MVSHSYTSLMTPLSLTLASMLMCFTPTGLDSIRDLKKIQIYQGIWICFIYQAYPDQFSSFNQICSQLNKSNIEKKILILNNNIVYHKLPSLLRVTSCVNSTKVQSSHKKGINYQHFYWYTKRVCSSLNSLIRTQ